MLAQPEFAEFTRRRAFRRLVPLLFVCCMIAYLDRVNIGFAALSMNKDLGLTPTTFGLANTIFYLAYLAFEVPSNLMMARVGARRWIARIMVSWGIASVATVFAVGPWSLYGIRALVGIAEAGFLPGVLLYFTYWFPSTWRGRATATLLISQPLATGFGSLLSGIIMSRWDQYLGLADWQWLFILEGIPAVILGIVVYLYLPNDPGDADWLQDAERDALRADIVNELPPSDLSRGYWKSLWAPGLVRLCVGYFGLVVTINSLATWSPQIIRDALGGQNDFLRVGILSAVPGLAAVIVTPLFGQSSDKTGERRGHYVAAVAGGIVGWLLVIFMHEPLIRVLGLAMCTAASMSAMTVLWTIPPSVLSHGNRPVGIAVISMCGILASITSPTIIGFLRDATGSFSAGLWFALTFLVVSILCIGTLPLSLVEQGKPQMRGTPKRSGV